MPGVFILWHRSLGLGEGGHFDLVSVLILQHFFSFLNLFVFSFPKTELGNRMYSILSFPLDKAELTKWGYQKSVRDTQWKLRDWGHSRHTASPGLGTVPPDDPVQRRPYTSALVG